MITFTSRDPRGAAAQTLSNTKMDSGQATGRQHVRGPLTSWGQVRGDFWPLECLLENTIRDMHKHTESKHPLWQKSGAFVIEAENLHTAWENLQLSSLQSLSWYVHGLSFLFALLYSELLGSSVWSGEDSLPKQSSALGRMAGSWWETEIGSQNTQKGYNANQSFLFHAAGPNKRCPLSGLFRW